MQAWIQLPHAGGKSSACMAVCMDILSVVVRKRVEMIGNKVGLFGAGIVDGMLGSVSHV